MTLRWKFWKRFKVDQSSPVPEAPKSTAWPPLMSRRELIALQRTIGNQAVLEFLASRRRPRTPAALPATKSWFSFWKRKKPKA